MVETPCIKICQILEGETLCLGCGRTLDEIARWTSMRHEERLAIMAGLAERLKQADIQDNTS
ncbi:DUF1289 domain-containing protein [Pleomorphomonas sp. JP5]|uniref:DUF1289 domain-containing protein n=1 Tax=Pleomorphomonas sp. JP5 TaxID=2942998 RepID=UPI002042D852|nr:DUF1289 domain-containing protein [Pleomorphomonas sp. JP5]MCM5560335.1 DUF1289 domain-containing protein [Pleomorphomonas sp. JP5]